MITFFLFLFEILINKQLIKHSKNIMKLIKFRFYFPKRPLIFFIAARASVVSKVPLWFVSICLKTCLIAILPIEPSPSDSTAMTKS